MRRRPPVQIVRATKSRAGSVPPAGRPPGDRGEPGPSQQADKLEWKFEKSKTFYQEMTTKTKQTMKIMAMDNITQNHDQTFIFSWTPVQEDNDKNWIVSQKIEGVKMDIDIGGNKITYDS